MNWRGRASLALVTVAILGSGAAAGVANEKPAPLVIQEQGSFAVGGTVVTAPGTFDPIRHGAYNPADQSVAGLGWRTAIKNRNVRAIVSYEPGSNFPFPEGETPAAYPGRGVPLADFMLLTKIPIAIYYGDNIPEKLAAEPGPEQWRAFLGVARQWRDAVNKHGGESPSSICLSWASAGTPTSRCPT